MIELEKLALNEFTNDVCTQFIDEVRDFTNSNENDNETKKLILSNIESKLDYTLFNVHDLLKAELQKADDEIKKDGIPSYAEIRYFAELAERYREALFITRIHLVNAGGEL